MVHTCDELFKIKLVRNCCPFPIATMPHYAHYTLVFVKEGFESAQSLIVEAATCFEGLFRHGHQCDGLKNDINKMNVKLFGYFLDLLFRFFGKGLAEIGNNNCFPVADESIKHKRKKSADGVK